MQLKTGILRAQSAQEIFVPFNPEVGMQSSLHQHARAAERNRLINLVANLVDGADVSVGRARPSIERAEGANHIADVRVIDVAINDVSDDVVRMITTPNLIGGRADSRHVI